MELQIKLYQFLKISIMRIFLSMIIGLFLAVFYLGCACKFKSMKNKIHLKTFVKSLVERKFGEFFIYPIHNETINKIWNDTTNHKLLDEVLNGTNTSNEAKFLASEVLFQKDILFLQRHNPKKIAEIYTQALVNNYTGMANSWGLLYNHEEEGTVGIAFLTLRNNAIPSLTSLLEDSSISLYYKGSEEATIGNSYKYRIKDFAAYYIGRIIGNPLKYYSTYEERDIQIQELKKNLENKAYSTK